MARPCPLPDRAHGRHRSGDAGCARESDRLASHRPAAVRASRPFAPGGRRHSSRAAQTWIAENYHERAPVAAMVRLGGLAERSFKRRFRQVTPAVCHRWSTYTRCGSRRPSTCSKGGNGRGDREPDRLRGCGFFQPPVSPPGEADAGSVPQALWRHAQGDSERDPVERAARLQAIAPGFAPCSM